jgi:tetratricopeptide (TPR) repeat protein
MTNLKDTARPFSETVVITDDQTWIWQLISGLLSRLDSAHVRLPSTVPLRQSWERLKLAPHFILHWECHGRSASALVEEILSINPAFDVAGRIVVVTTDPTHEDVVTIAELGITRIVRLGTKEKDTARAMTELQNHISAKHSLSPAEIRWRQLIRTATMLSESSPAECRDHVASELRDLGGADRSARYYDVEAFLHMSCGRDREAIASWHQALERNPKYHHAYFSLATFYRHRGRLDEAMAILQKLQAISRQSTARLVAMAEIHVARKELALAESLYRSALDRDPMCSPALSGLAELRFHAGDLEQARFLLSKSQSVQRTAAHLNELGITMVREGRYQEALEHYTRAQYVLPQQDKSALLYFNIGLCYARWGRPQIACEFLKISLIKEPQFKKAQRLLARLDTAAKVTPRVA